MSIHANQGLLFEIVNEVYVYIFEKTKEHVERKLVKSMEKIEKVLDFLKKHVENLE